MSRLPAAPDEGSPHDALVGWQMVRRSLYGPVGEVAGRSEFTRRHSTEVILGELVTPAPGWWVCPTCDRRVDRADETGTVTGRMCTGPDGATRHRRHAPVSMVVRR